MTALDKRIDVIDLYVEDLEGTKAFYESVFGLPATRRSDCVDFAFADTIVHLRDATSAEEFIAPAKVAGSRDGSAGALGILVDDLDRVCTELAGLGVKLINGPATGPTGMRRACFADPAGQVWAVVEGLSQTGQQDRPAKVGSWHKTEKRIGRVELFVQNLSREASYYRDLFGLPGKDQAGDFEDFRLEGLTLGLLSVAAATDFIEPARVADSGSGVRFTFCTFADDALVVGSELAKRGVKPFKGPTDFPFGHRIVSFRGPSGHIWEVVSQIPGAEGS
jgi:catechol 2,3-dioxygenase-like lactoylglutathione lyase family enzyme